MFQYWHANLTSHRSENVYLIVSLIGTGLALTPLNRHGVFGGTGDDAVYWMYVIAWVVVPPQS